MRQYTFLSCELAIMTFFIIGLNSTAISGELASYFNHIDTYPSDRESTGFSEAGQGLTHDGENWFFSRAGLLARVPFHVDLGSIESNLECNQDEVTCMFLSNQPGLDTWDHFGDIDFYEYTAAGGGIHRFLIVPLECTNCVSPRPPAALAIFDTVSFEYIDHAELPAQENGYASWVAVDPDGFAYSGRGSQVYKYAILWENLTMEQPAHWIAHADEFHLLNEDETHFQGAPAGGVFTQGGSILYTSSNQGVDAFSTFTKKRIRHISGPCHENEGLTILDVEQLPSGQRPPGVRGELHVLSVRLDLYRDDLFLNHFTNKIYVDGTYVGASDGSPVRPFQTIVEANSIIWDGSQLLITVGEYNGSLIIDKRTRLIADGGDGESVTIVGQQ